MTNKINDETRLALAAGRIKQAADLLVTAAKLIADGEYNNCKPGGETHRGKVLAGLTQSLPQVAVAAAQMANSTEYVQQRLNNASST